MLNSIQIKQQSMQDKNYSKKYLSRIIIILTGENQQNEKFWIILRDCGDFFSEINFNNKYDRNSETQKRKKLIKIYDDNT